MIELFSQPIIDEMESDNPRLIMAVEILFKSATLRAHTGLGEIIIDGNVYLGVGVLGSIDPVKQTSKTSPSSILLGMSGLDPTLVSETLNERTQGSKAKVMVCSLDEDEKVTSASIVFIGRVSTQRFKYQETMTVESELIDRLADWQRKGAKRFDHESHIVDFPGDMVLAYLAQMAEAPLFWGSSKDAPAMRYTK